MSRKLRIQYEGAVHHVINRGDRREPIFKDDEDREDFLETLGQWMGSRSNASNLVYAKQNC